MRRVVSWKPGDVILDRYEVQGVLGMGGMGTVYRVRHRGWNLDLAVKTPRADLIARRGAVEAFEREAQTWVNLGLHPHIVSCYYVRRVAGIPHVFAELLEGGDLAEGIRSGALYQGGVQAALRRILDIAIQFAWGLDHAHAQGLIHRDAKPGNVVMTTAGVAKVTDFGLAKAQAAAVRAGGLTPAYCSPEQAAGRTLTCATDVWSWAVSVLEMFTGEVCWPAGQVAGAALEAYVAGDRGDERRPRMPPDLPALLQRCLEMRPEARPTSLRAVADRLIDVYRQAIGAAYPRPMPRPAELHADGLNNRAVSLLDLNRRDEAEALLERTLEADACHAEASYNRGLLQWRAGRITDQALVRQLRDATYWLGLIHLERADADAALAALHTAAQDPDAGPEVAAARAVAEAGRGVWASCLQTLDCPAAWYAHSLQLSPDGWLGVFDAENAIEVWDLNAGRRVRRLVGHEHAIGQLALSADGMHVVSADEDGTLKWWELASGQCLRTLNGPRAEIAQLALSADGRHVLAGTRGGHAGPSVLRLWDIEAGQCVCVAAATPGAGLCGLQLGPDSRQAVWADGTQIHMWDLATNRSGGAIRTDDATRTLAVDWQRQRVAAAGDHGALRLWDLPSGDGVGVCVGPTQRVETLVLAADGRRAVTAGADRMLRLWDLTTGRCLRTFGIGDAALVALSRDGHRALTRSRNGTACALGIWSLRGAGAHAAPFMLARPRASAALAAEAGRVRQAVEDARAALERGAPAEAHARLATARCEPGHERDRAVLDLWHAAGRHGRRTALRGAWRVRQWPAGNGRGAVPAVLCPDGQHALCGNGDGRVVWVWDLTKGKAVRALRPADDAEPVSGIAVGADGRTVLVGRRGGELQQWDATTGRLLQTWQCARVERQPLAISLGPDGRRLLSGIGNELRIWDLYTGQSLLAPPLPSPRHGIRAVSLTPDSRWGLSCDSDTPYLWDLMGRRLERRLQGHAALVTCLGISPDGRTALSGSLDRTLRLWDLASGQRLHTLAGHTDAVLAAAFSPDGRWAISAGTDSTIRIWSLANGQSVCSLDGHTGPVRSLSLTPDGRWLLSGSADETLCLWELDWDYEVPAPAEWDEGARPYLHDFLTRHSHLGSAGLYGAGVPAWDEADLRGLMADLQRRGYGWLCPAGVRRALEQMAADWQGIAEPMSVRP